MRSRIRNKAHIVKRKVSDLRRKVNNKQTDYIYSIDSPKKTTISVKKIVVDGWIISKKGLNLEKVRIVNNENVHEGKAGIRRPDVEQSFKTQSALQSGFSIEFMFEDGVSYLEADFGEGFKRIHAFEFKYMPEKLVEALYNKDLAANWAEHLNLLENRKKYFFEENQEESFKRSKDDPRLVATYLPQFHPIPENDKAWGKGFTEWQNVASAQPRFIGHQQPVLPKDLGYYDLRLEENILEQIKLAKQHGIYGFCFYYYWFSGHKLLEKPLNSFLKNKDWDFNFLICWANENWTKRWDGRDSDVIVAQKYLDEDPLSFIKEVEPILTDPRYIKEDGKPVLMVYRASELKDPEKYTKVWREYFKQKHRLELHLVAVISFDDKDPREFGFDAALDFAPLGSFFKKDKFKDGKYPFKSVTSELLDINFEGDVVDYRQLATNRNLIDAFDYPTYKCVMPSWDNDARKKGKGFVFYNSSPDIYSGWLNSVLEHETTKRKSPLVFINAWNEWAEGAMLEPSMHLGHAALNRTTEVLSQYSGANINQNNFPLFGLRHKKPSTKLAVVIHLYYPEKWNFIKKKLKLIGQDYDLFVSINEKDINFIEKIQKDNKDATVTIVPNRGRDVLPFIHIAGRLKYLGYEYVLKLHAKKSKHRQDGGEWFENLVDGLLTNEGTVNDIIAILRTQKTIIGPAGHFLNFERYAGSNESHIGQILEKIYNKKTSQKVLNNTSAYGYFAGTMFWAHIDSIRPILDMNLLPDDFESEQGQIDGTMAHAIERSLSLIPQLNGLDIYQVSSRGLKVISSEESIRDYRYAP